MGVVINTDRSAHGALTMIQRSYTENVFPATFEYPNKHVQKIDLSMTSIVKRTIIDNIYQNFMKKFILGAQNLMKRFLIILVDKTHYK